MHLHPRRVFLLQLAAGGSTALLSASGLAAEEESTVQLTEADPYARSMGFRLSTEKVDKVKYPRHAVEQRCSKCQLYSGKAGAPVGPCSFYGGRLVPVDGWCRNFKVVKA